MGDRIKDQVDELEATLALMQIDYRQLAERVGLKPETMRKAVKGHQALSRRVMESVRELRNRVVHNADPHKELNETAKPWRTSDRSGIVQWLSRDRSDEELKAEMNAAMAENEHRIARLILDELERRANADEPADSSSRVDTPRIFNDINSKQVSDAAEASLEAAAGEALDPPPGSRPKSATDEPSASKPAPTRDGKKES